MPHISRIMAVPDHKRLIPVTAVMGAIFIMFTDTLVRSLSPGEVPISIVTSLIGAPFLGCLMFGRKGRGQNRLQKFVSMLE